MIAIASANTTANASVEAVSGISPLFRIILSVTTTTPIFINIFYIIVCFSALKNRFHHLLVLTLCIGDSVLSLSLTLYSLTKLVTSLARNVSVCTFETFCVIYGLVLTYTMVFWICAERYYVVKSYNFGVQEFFERFKLVIIGGTIAFDLLFTIELIMFVPHEPVIEQCTVPDLFGKEMGLFIKFIVGVLTGLMGGIIVLCCKTSMLIWQYFFKNNRVLPKTSICEGQTTSYNKGHSEDLPKTTDESLRPVVSEMSRKISIIVDKWKLERLANDQNESEEDKIRVVPIPKMKFKPDAWEKRAFVTTIVIAISTLFLTGPFVLSFWLDYVYGARFTSQKVRLVLFVPLVINSMINPFIYVWRIREIQDKIRKLFSCSCNS